jgi:putative ABC transport system permease protein
MMGIRLVEGRFLNSFDHQTSPKVVVISQRLAKRLSPDRSILGRRILPMDRFGPGPQEWLTVVGIVSDVKHGGPVGGIGMDIYVPYLQTGWQSSSFVVRTELAPESIHREALRAVANVDPGEPPNDLLMMDQALARTIWQRRLAGLVFSILATLALTLAAIGIYGVISYSVNQRVREIGIRSALGATRTHILTMVLRQGAFFVLPGIALGIALGLLLGRAVSALLFEVNPNDPTILGVVTTILLAIATCGCLGPAARAARIDPLVALRGE